MVGARGTISLLAAALLALAGAALAGCEAQEDYFHRLHGPSDVALLEPGGVFEVPVAYVPSFRTGQIAKLDLKRIDLLVEEGAASWLAAPYLACGRDRVLDQVAVTTDGATRVDVWVSDSQRGQVLRVPHVIPDGEGGYSFATVSWEPPVLRDPDGAERSGGPELAELDVRPGFATTETWTITYRGHSWVLEGTASGLQRQEAVPGLAYVSDGDELGFTVLHHGEPVEQGTSFTLVTDTGIEAYDVPGVVSDLKTTPDGAWVVAAVLGYGGDGVLWAHDWQTGISTEVALPAGTVPENLGLHRDGDALFVADSSAASRVLRVDLDGADPALWPVSEIPVSLPGFDVAHGGDAERDYLFVAAAYDETIEILDLASGEPVDANVWTPEVDPVDIGSLITGLDATRRPIEMNSLTGVGLHEEKYAVVASTYAGYLHVIEADTGCQAVESTFGPYLETTEFGTQVTYYDVGPANDVILLTDPVSAQAVSVNPCGGVARDQLWTLRYREDTLDWEVEGSISGIQERHAVEDVRYISDDGEISFVIASGARAASDGDWMRFSVNDGISPVGVLELPGDPLLFTDVFDFREGAWWEHREREVALVPNAGNDVVMWVHVEGYGDGGLKYFR